MTALETTLTIFGVVMLASSVVEGVVLKFVLKHAYDWRSSLASFAVLIGRSLTEIVPVAIAMPGAYWLYKHRVLEPTNYGVWSYFILFVALEFVYY